MKYLNILALLLAVLQYVYATSTLDETIDDGLNPLCDSFVHESYVAKTDDGYKLVFIMNSDDTHVGYVDVHWAVSKFVNSDVEPVEVDFRMNKVNSLRYENVLSKSSLGEEFDFGHGDMLRYFFRYWAVPKNASDAGFMCNTDIMWFGSATNAAKVQN